MADVSGTVTTRAVLDAAGSTSDTIFADAIMATMPTLVVDKYNLLMKKDVPDQYESITFPIHTNFDLSWTNLSGTGSDLGSEVSVTSMPATTYKKITPVVYSAGIFVHDMVDLFTNKENFEEHVKRAQVAVQRKIDRDAINDGLFNVVQTAGSNEIRCAGGFGTGSVSSGSTLTADDLTDAKYSMLTGSDPYTADTVLMHTNQYNQLVQSSEFQAQTYRISGKATFRDGELVRYDGMDIVVTELVNDQDAFGTTEGGYYTVAGHPVAVFDRKIAGALATKNASFKVNTIDDRLKHGKYKVFDIGFKADVLVPASIKILRAAD